MSFFIGEQDFRKGYKLQKYADKAIDNLKFKFPYKPTNKAVRIVSFLTFDGHLTPNSKMFLFTAGSPKGLEEISKCVEEEFGKKGKFRKIPTNTYGESYEYRICSLPIGRILHIMGVPSGNKVLRPFSIPQWILQNNEFSIEYVRVAFECEGSHWIEKDGRNRIGFRINKEISLIENGIDFVENIIHILNLNDIKTTKIWVTDSNRRKDGNVTMSIQFRIKEESYNEFNKLIKLDKTGSRRHGTALMAA